MQNSKINQSLNYMALLLLGLSLFWVTAMTLVRAQTDAPRPQQKPEAGPVIVGPPIVKPLPPALQDDFRAAQDEVEKLQARLNAATLRGQNVLYRAALELKMTAAEAETCEVKQVVRDKAGPVWSFVCPSEPVQTPTPAPTPTVKR